MLRRLLFALVLCFASDAWANPNVAIFTGARFCTGCGVGFNTGVYVSMIRGIYPQLREIAGTDLASITAGLDGMDAVFVPYTIANRTTLGLDAQTKLALVDFVRRGGRMIFVPDVQGMLRLDIQELFQVDIGAVPGAPATATCDAAAGSRIGVEELPATLSGLHIGRAITVTATSPIIGFCGPASAPVAAGFPFGDGVVYLHGVIFQGNGPTLPADHTALFRRMVESNLIGTHLCHAVGGSLRCGGSNKLGQLGVGDTVQRVSRYQDLRPVNLGATFQTARVQVSRGTTCAISDQGDVKCFGANKHGQLAKGDVMPRGGAGDELGDDYTPVPLGGRGAEGVALSETHVCALSTNGEVLCWGRGHKGQLGTEAADSVGDSAGEVPAVVDLRERAMQVVTGSNHTCALTTTSKVFCFGENRVGQLGVGNTVNVGDRAGTMGAALQPTDLGAGFVPVALAAGSDFTCALSRLGQIKCWGANGLGQLGHGQAWTSRGGASGEMGDALPFTDLGKGQAFATLACGTFHCCAATTSGTLKCWGSNASGQLGLGDTLSRGIDASQMGDQLPFVRLPPRERVQEIHLTGGSTCVRTESGMRCFGDNASGQLATGDRQNMGGTPTTVPRLLTPIY